MGRQVSPIRGVISSTDVSPLWLEPNELTTSRVFRSQNTSTSFQRTPRFTSRKSVTA